MAGQAARLQRPTAMPRGQTSQQPRRLWLRPPYPPVTSSKMVTPSAHTSTFSLVGAMSVALICPLITRSTGGRATTCRGAPGAEGTASGENRCGVQAGLPRLAGGVVGRWVSVCAASGTHLGRHVLHSAYRRDGRLLPHAHGQPKVALHSAAGGTPGRLSQTHPVWLHTPTGAFASPASPCLGRR